MSRKRISNRVKEALNEAIERGFHFSEFIIRRNPLGSKHYRFIIPGGTMSRSQIKRELNKPQKMYDVNNNEISKSIKDKGFLRALLEGLGFGGGHTSF